MAVERSTSDRDETTSMCAHHRAVAIAATAAVFLFGLAASAAYAGSISSGTWYEFSWPSGGVVQANGCRPNDPAGIGCLPAGVTDTTFADAPPWVFNAPAGGATFTVTDADERRDRFDVFDFGTLIGSTSVPSGSGSCGDDPVPCLADADTSSGIFALAVGAHQITIFENSQIGKEGVGFFRWDAEEIIPPPGVPEPGSLALLGAALAGVGWFARRNRSAL